MLQRRLFRQNIQIFFRWSFFIVEGDEKDEQNLFLFLFAFWIVMYDQTDQYLNKVLLKSDNKEYLSRLTLFQCPHRSRVIRQQINKFKQNSRRKRDFHKFTDIGREFQWIKLHKWFF